jgi:hypothetical protein
MIKVAIIGPLSVVKKHEVELARIRDLQITARCDSTSFSHKTSLGGTLADGEILEKIIENTDALIVAGSDDFCYLAMVFALRNARHTYIYPSLLRSVNDAMSLAKMAREANVILKAGKTHNVNSYGLLRSVSDISGIKMIELQHYHRINQENKTSIHEILLADLEIINILIKARVISIKAKGLCMLSLQPEIVNARLEYDNGCAVIYNCNIVGAQDEFVATVVMKNKIIKYNLISNEITSWSMNQTGDQRENSIQSESAYTKAFETDLSDLSVFFDFIRSGPSFLSIGDNGFESFILADRILEKVMKTLIHCV